MIEIWCKKAWTGLEPPRKRLAAKTRDILKSRRIGVVLTLTVPLLVVLWHLVVLAGRPHVNPIVTQLQSFQSFGGLEGNFMPDNDGTRLLCLRAAGDGIGVGLFFCTIGDSHEKQLYQEISGQPSMPSETFLGWSSDDQFFAYGRRGQWNYLWEIVIGNGDSGDTVAAIPFNVRALSGAWLSPSNLVVVGDNRVLYSVINSQGKWLAPKPFPYFRQASNRLGKGPILNLTAFDDNSVVWQQGNAIWRCGENSDGPEKIWDANTNSLLEYSYSRETHRFLLHCRNRSGQFFTFFYPDTPDKPPEIVGINTAGYRPEGLTFVNNGEGYAFMSQIGSTNMLFIKPGDSRVPVEYRWPDQIAKIAASQNEIFVSSSLAAGPLAIYRYDVASGSVQCAVPIAEGRFDYLTNCTVTQNEITNAAGQTVTYYLGRPSNAGAIKKHPLILGLLLKPVWYQFYGALVEGGSYFAYVGPHDDDYSQESDDLLAVYKSLAKRPDIDTNNVYLYGVSASTPAVCELLESKPRLWRGAILYGPLDFPDPSKIAGLRLFIDTGEDDPAFGKRGLQYLDEAAKAGIPVTLLVHPGEGHVFKLPKTFRERMRETLIFLDGH